jgi:capsular polysaccharide transport system permease protein
MDQISIGRARRRPSFLASLALQVRVVVALMIREAQAKYTQETFGFFWTVAEPMILTIGVILLWTVTGRSEARGEVTVFAMALTAYSHVQLWRLTVLESLGSIKHSGWLFYHQNVKMFDTFLARVLLTSLSVFTSFAIVASAGVLFNFMAPVRDPGFVVGAWCVDTIFVASFASVVAGLSEFSELVEKLLHPVMYLSLPLTGAFTLASWLPPRARVLVDWSPLANACEMFRAAVFPESVKTIWSLPFILGSSLILFLIGIPLMTRARKIITVQ